MSDVIVMCWRVSLLLLAIVAGVLIVRKIMAMVDQLVDELFKFED